VLSNIDHSLLIIIAAVTFSGFVKGSLGLGFSTICLAILANFLELKLAISIVLLPSLLSNIIVMVDTGNFKHSLKVFWPMLLAAIFGMAIGLKILHQEESKLSTILLAIVLIIYGVYGLVANLMRREFKLENHRIKLLNPIIGCATGIVNGATGSQILPIMPYLLALNISKDLLVQTINLSFTICSIIMLSSFLYLKTIELQTLTTYSLAIIPMAIGVWLGNKIRKKLSEERFKLLSMGLIVILGVALLLRHIAEIS